MSIKIYAAVSGTIFAIVAVVQVVRAFNSWPVQIASLQIPVGLSWLAALGTGALAAWAFSVARR